MKLLKESKVRRAFVLPDSAAFVILLSYVYLASMINKRDFSCTCPRHWLFPFVPDTTSFRNDATIEHVLMTGTSALHAQLGRHEYSTPSSISYFAYGSDSLSNGSLCDCVWQSLSSIHLTFQEHLFVDFSYVSRLCFLRNNRGSCEKS